MYAIKVDGQEVYSPALLNEPEQQLLSISLQLEIDTPGSLSFIIPPGHAAHDSIHKLKSVVTMEWDGKEIFRGRVLEEKTDAFNQREVYCEGELSFLLDSVVRPFTFEGTTRAFVEKVITIHNEQVEEYKRFTLGDFSALTDDTVIPLESYGYADSLSAIRAALEPHEGYLFARYENGTHYLDFVAAYEADEGQAIEFGTNLVDLDNQTAAEDLCTVLLPIGGILEDGTTVTIESVNGGKDTIENARAISQYGRIVKTYAFDDVTDPAVLLQKAREKLDSMSFVETLILQAVDMHLLDEEKGIILPGRRALIHTTPHGIDNKRKLCTTLELDPENPEKATYTFGKPEKTQSGAAALIASRVEQHTRSVQMLYKHYTETDYTAQIQAGLLDKQGEYLSQAMLDIDGINAELLLKAERKALDALSGEFNTLETNVTISADGLREIIQRNDKIISEFKATIDGLEHWVTDSEGNIAELIATVRGMESKVTTADGKVSILTNTADGMTSTLLSQGGDLAQFKTRIDEIGAVVRDSNGLMGYLSVKSDSITAKVKGVGDQVSNLALTADGLSYTLTQQGQELASLKALIDEISMTIRDTNGAIGQLVVKSNNITAKVVSADQNMSSKFEMLAGVIGLETKANGTTVSLRLDAAENKITAQAKEIGLKADKVDLGKYATVEQMESEFGRIDDLESGITTAKLLRATQLKITNDATFGSITTPSATLTSLKLGGNAAVWIEQKIVEGVKLSLTKANIPLFNANGTFIQNVEVVTNVTASTTSSTKKVLTA